jgi:hypothetical protein
VTDDGEPLPFSCPPLRADEYGEHAKEEGGNDDVGRRGAEDDLVRCDVTGEEAVLMDSATMKYFDAEVRIWM